MKIFLPRLLLFSFSFILCSDNYAQQDSIRHKTIELISKALYSYFYDESMATQMADTLRHHLQTGAYDTANNNDEFFFLVTQDLRRICRDDHMLVCTPAYPYTAPDNDGENLTPKQLKELRKKGREATKLLEEYNRRQRMEAMLFGDIKIINQDVGYLQVAAFTADPDKYQKCNMKDAAKFLSSTDNLIIDLRENSGGFIRQLVYFISYFTPIPQQYLFLSRQFLRYQPVPVTEIKRAYYSEATIKRAFFQKKIFVLVDKYTFSAGESAAYLLKKLCPEVLLIGEHTSGGVGAVFSPQHYRYFDITIPSVRLIDEERNYHIPAGGIAPDIAVPADSAYEVALKLANTRQPQNLKKEKYLRKLTPEKTNAAAPVDLNKYAGDYLKLKIVNRANVLFMEYDNHPPVQLAFLETDVFITSIGSRQIRFIRTGEGLITGVQVQISEASKETFMKRPVVRPASVIAK